MKRVSRSNALALAVTVGVGSWGCRDTEEGGGGGGGSDPDAGGDSVEAVSIQDVQGDSVSVGDEVALRDVVVVAVDSFGDRQGSVYVMEPEGGPHSGVAIFLTGGEASGIARGDLIDVEGGVKEEFAFDDDDSGRSLTQIVAAEGGDISLTSVGEGEVPEPEVVDPAELAADDEEAERWEGVLIEFQDVAVESAPETITGDDTFKEMSVTGGFRVVSDLAPLSEEISVGDCYASITGIVSYAFNYQLFHTSEQALVADEEACPAAADPVTVREIKQGDGVEVGDNVRVENAVVTFIANDGDDERLFIQDQLDDPNNPEQFNGILVFRGQADDPGPLPDELQEGSVVEVAGEVDEFAGATQIAGNIQLTLQDEDPVDPVVLTESLAVDELADAGEVGDPFEHVLIELQDVEVVGEDTEFAGGFLIGDGGSEELLIDEFYMYGELPAEVDVGTCFARLPGVMDRTDFDERTAERRLRLTDGNDIALDGDCSFE